MRTRNTQIAQIGKVASIRAVIGVRMAGNCQKFPAAPSPMRRAATRWIVTAFGAFALLVLPALSQAKDDQHACTGRLRYAINGTDKGYVEDVLSGSYSAVRKSAAGKTERAERESARNKLRNECGKRDSTCFEGKRNDAILGQLIAAKVCTSEWKSFEGELVLETSGEPGCGEDRGDRQARFSIYKDTVRCPNNVQPTWAPATPPSWAVKVPLDYLAVPMNTALDFLSIRLNNHRGGDYLANDCIATLTLPGQAPKRIPLEQIPQFTYDPPVLKSMCFYVDDLRSEFLKATYERGSHGTFRVDVGFDSNGREVKGYSCKKDRDSGAPDAHIDNLKVSVRFKLRPTANGDALTYALEDASANFDFKMLGGKAAVVNFVKPKFDTEVKQKIRSAIEKGLVSGLSDSAFAAKAKETLEQYTRKVNTVSDMIQREAKGVAVPNLRFAIDGDHLLVWVKK